MRDETVDRRRLLTGAVAAAALGPWGGRGAAAAAPVERTTRAFLDEYGIRYPVVSAGMAFVSTPPLVAAVSRAGGLGTLGGSPLPPPAVQQLIAQTRARTDRPFGMNLIVANGFPGSAFPFTTDAHVAVCALERVPVVSFHWDLPQQRWVDTLHRAGSRVWVQVGTVREAVAAAALGVDAVIAQGAEAGGHGRATVPLRALLPAVRRAVTVPVLAAGGIATAGDVAAARRAGAAAAWVGTRFVATVEAYAHDEYKRRIVASDGTDTVTTTMFGPEWPGAPLRVLRNRVVDEWAGREREIPTPPPPPAVIGTTRIAGAPYAMPKFSAVLPTPDTVGDWEEMAFAAGGDAARSVREVLPAAAVVRALATGR